MSSHEILNAFSNRVQASVGSHMYGSEESRKAGIEVGRSKTVSVEFVILIDSMLTVRSRMSCDPKLQETSLGINFEVS